MHRACCSVCGRVCEPRRSSSKGQACGQAEHHSGGQSLPRSQRPRRTGATGARQALLLTWGEEASSSTCRPGPRLRRLPGQPALFAGSFRCHIFTGSAVATKYQHSSDCTFQASKLFKARCYIFLSQPWKNTNKTCVLQGLICTWGTRLVTPLGTCPHCGPRVLLPAILPSSKKDPLQSGVWRSLAWRGEGF